MSSKGRLRRTVSRSFKTHGVSLQHGVMERIVAFCEDRQQAHAELLGSSFADDDKENEQLDINALIGKLSELTVAQTLKKSAVVSLDDLEPVLAQLEYNSGGKADGGLDVGGDMALALAETGGLLSIVDAFKMPRFKYNRVTKSFVRLKPHKATTATASAMCSRSGAVVGATDTFDYPTDSGCEFPLHGSAADQFTMFKDRYEILLERTLRNKKFYKSSLRSDTEQRSITTTSELAGNRGEVVWLFGMLCELAEGALHLMDLNGSVKLAIHHSTKFMPGLFTWGCLVLVEGAMDPLRAVLNVQAMGHPVYDGRESVLKQHPSLDFVPFEKKSRILEIEKSATEDMFVFVSNVHLDSATTVEYLSRLFEGYSAAEMPPSLFILMGDFSRQRLGPNLRDMRQFAALFDKLADLILAYPKLVQQCSFVLIPGPNDPSVGRVLPRPGLMPSVTRKLRAKVQAFFPSNPCRIRFGTQEIVVFRDNLLQRMRRKCVVTPELRESENMSEHLVQSVLDQAHLCPLPLATAPIYWNYDHSLRLFPAPDLLVLADSHDEYQKQYHNVNAICPDDFNAKGRFVAYFPATKEVDFSEVPSA